MNWLYSELQAFENLENLIEQYQKGFSDDKLIQYQRNLLKAEGLI